MVLGGLNTRQILERAGYHIENAWKTKEPKLAEVLCDDADSALSRAATAANWAPKYSDDQDLRNAIAAAYFRLSELQRHLGHDDKAQNSSKIAEKLDHSRYGQDQETSFGICGLDDDVRSIQSLQSHINASDRVFLHPSGLLTSGDNMPTRKFRFPGPFENLDNTPQLVYCLSLLQGSRLHGETLKPDALTWLQETKKNPEEQERLLALAKDVIKEFTREELKDAKAVAEVVCLAPVLERDDFHLLIRQFCAGIDKPGPLDYLQLEGLAQVIPSASSGYLGADDLVRVLKLLNTCLKETHQQSTDRIFLLTMAVSNVLDAMADTKVKDLDREALHEHLKSYLEVLQKSKDPYLIYQAAYASQALMYVPDNETLWQGALRRTGKVLQGTAELVSATKGLDLNKFIEGLEKIQKGVSGLPRAFKLAKDAYDGAVSLSNSGQNFLDCLKDGLSFQRKRAWYPALRRVDTMLQGDQFDEFKSFVENVPCRYDPAFQWGICQRLGEAAANSLLDPSTRKGAISLLGDIYQMDEKWGQHNNIKQWIVNILMRLAAHSNGVVKSSVGTLLQALEKDGVPKKQGLFQACQKEKACMYPLNIALPQLRSMSLLYRAQNRPEVEPNLKWFRAQRKKDRGNTLYIQPQAKTSLQASDDGCFLLMEEVKKFLDSDQKVFLILGDSGAGKSAFSRELEHELWEEYRVAGRIPLHISLPAIDKPEHDMISKQLRRAGFTEPQIRELKLHRDFILICDGYDESQQTHNLYVSNRLNQSVEWRAQMVISCRSEYLGADYRDRFQPVDRNRQVEPTESAAFQEAVLTPFSEVQIIEYIRQFVHAHVQLWKERDYQKALDSIPGLKELVRNPFMLTLALDVLPRMVDLERLSTTHITRVALYDHFVEHWLERGKKRIRERTLSPQEKATFDSLADEGFTQNGISFLKRLAVAIYKEQDGQPVVEYLRFKDQGSWKADFFGSEEEKQLLREACPLIRNGSQHKFIHRSLLEYGLARAVFDPHERRKQSALISLRNRRGSASSVLSFEAQGDSKGTGNGSRDQDPHGYVSPLVSRSFVKELSLMQFLQELVQQEPDFKQQLLSYIELSKKDKKWRIAAANAITLLVRAGVQFNNRDLRGIQIPGADLSHGSFDSVQFQGADLRKVNLRNTWLRQADFRRAYMLGVQFGEFLAEESRLLACAYSPDGKSFAVGLETGNISVYSASNQERISTIPINDARVTCLAYSPKGDQIVSGSDDKVVRLWEIVTELCRHTLQGHDEEVTSVAYSPKEDMVASGSSDGTARLWDVEHGTCVQILQHDCPVTSVTYSPQGSEIVSGGFDGRIQLWNVKTGECTQTMGVHISKITSVAYSPMGDQIVTGSSDHTVRLWDVKARACRHTLTGHFGDITSVVYSPKGELVASGSEDKTMRIWDAATGNCHRTTSGHMDRVTGVSFSPKGDLIATSSWDMTVRLWEAEASASSPSVNNRNTRISSAVFSPQGDVIVTGNSDGTLRLWDTRTGDIRHILCCSDSGVTSVVVSSKGNLVASSCADHTVHVWDLGAGTHSKPFNDRCNTVCNIALSPNGDAIVTGSIENAVHSWDVSTGTLQVLGTHDGTVTSVAFSPNGSVVASGSSDCTVRLWSMEPGKCLHVMTGHTDGVSSIIFSSKGDQIASSSPDNTLRLWNVETGSCLHILTGHEGPITSIAFSPSGDQVASSSKDKTVRRWNTDSGISLKVLTGHGDTVSSVAYSLKKGLIASASDDRTMRLWDISSGQERGVIQCFGKVISISWSVISYTNFLVTTCDDGSVRLWKVIEGTQCRVSMQWSTGYDGLNLERASIRDVRGLSLANTRFLKQHGAEGEPGRDIASIPPHVFAEDCSPSVAAFSLPEADERISNTQQLAYCLDLLQSSRQLEDIQDQAARGWILKTEEDSDEQERLKILATDVIRAFKRDEIRDAKSITEVLFLAPVLENNDFRHLLKEFYSGIDQSSLLDVHQIEGLARLIQSAGSGYLETDDLVKIAELLSTRLRDIHQGSANYLPRLALAVSCVLDSMADSDINGLDREKLHEPLSSFLDELKGSLDPYLVYQAAYASQALLCVPDIESIWQKISRKEEAVEDSDLNEFLEALGNIHQGLGEIMDSAVRPSYENTTTLGMSGQGLLEHLNESLCFDRKQTWYPALRGADALIRKGQFPKFKKLVCEAPCRYNTAFHWGVCQLLGDIAANSTWEVGVRENAMEFLGEFYQNDAAWGLAITTMQWISNILMRLATLHGRDIQGM